MLQTIVVSSVTEIGNSLLLGIYIPRYAKKLGKQIYSGEEPKQIYRVTYRYKQCER